MIARTVLGLAALGFLAVGLRAQDSGSDAGPATMPALAVVGTDFRGSVVVDFGEDLSPALAERLRVEPQRPFFGTEGGHVGRPTQLFDLGGVALGDLLGPGPHSPEVLGRITDQLLVANRDLLGLPLGSGVLVRRRVKVDDTNIGVIYDQCAADTGLPVIGSMVKVNYDSRGKPSSILDVTWPDVDGLSAVRLRAGDAEALVPSLLATVDWFGTTRNLASERVAVRRAGILPRDDGTLRPAYEIEVEGWVSGGGQRTTKAHLVAYIDAVDGALLRTVPAVSRAAPPGDTFTETGVVEHFDGDPFDPPLLQTWLLGGGTAAVPVHVMNVWGLDSEYAELRAPYARVTNGSIQGPIVTPGYAFMPLGLPDPYHYHIADTTAFKAITDLQRNLVALGFGGVMAANQVGVDALDWTMGNSFYFASTNAIFLDNAAIDALDRTVVGHEYSHAVACGVGGDSIWGCALDHAHGTGGAVNEAFADYLSTTIVNSLVFGPWYAKEPVYGVRRLDSSRNIVDDWVGLIHVDGHIFGTALWNLRKSIGSDVDRLAVQFLYHVTPTIDFNGALEAVIQADDDLFAGAHEGTIRRVFSLAKIYGAQAPPTWSTPFVMSDARPYPDAESSTKAYTIPGATSLRVTFDAFTKVNDSDALVVTNGAGVPIAGSPFLGEALRGQTVSVPGDTVRITLNSIIGNTSPLTFFPTGGAGYLVTNIAADDPLNLPPVPGMEVGPAFGFDPLVVEFDLSGAFDPDGQVVQVNLDPGDGSPLIALDWPSVQTLRHIYRRNGKGPIAATTAFEARAEFTDDSGATVIATRVISVSPYEPAPAWSDLGQALPGAAGAPLLIGSGSLADGSSNSVNLTHAAPSAVAGLFLALASTPVPFKGGTLVPVPFFDPVILNTSPAGAIPIPFVMPSGVPTGTEIWVQWAIQDSGAVQGVALSNAILGVTP